VFEKPSWVDRVGTLVIEIHDDLKPGAMASVVQIKGKRRSGATFRLMS
jgi:hypothetical protein